MRDLAPSKTLAAVLLALSLAAIASPAAAKPNEAQLDAIKANCRSDYMSNCWGVKRGGPEAFQCLEQHMSRLSAGCQQAVKAVAAANAPKPAPKPAAAPAPKPEAAPPAQSAETKPPAPAPAPTAAAKTTTAKPAPAPAAKHASTTAAATPKPAAPAKPAPSAASAPEAAPAPPSIVILGFIPPRKKLMVRRNCDGELRSYCAGVDFGEGRLLRCLQDNMPKLSPSCRGALARLAR